MPRQHVAIRLRITWLTLATAMLFAVLALIAPDFAPVNAHYVRSLDELRAVTQFSLGTDLANEFRGSLAADLLFLLAFGFLLRDSALWHERVSRRARRRRSTSRVARLAANLALLVMACDLIENTTMIRLLDALMTPSGTTTWLAVAVANGAAVGKWLTVAVVTSLLALLWWRQRSGCEGRDRLLAIATSVLWATAACGALALVALFPFPAARIEGAGTAGASPTSLLIAAQGVAAGTPALALVGQLALLGLPGLLLRFLVLARVPLTVMAVLVMLGPVAFGVARGLLGGVLQLSGIGLLAQVALTSLLVALAAGVQIHVIRAYAWQRCDDPKLRVLRHPGMRSMVFWSTVAAGMLLPLCALIASKNLPAPAWLALLGGAVAAIVIAVGVELAAAYLANPNTVRETPQAIIPALRIRWLTRWLCQVRRRPRPALLERVVALGNRVVRSVIGDGGGAGYIGRRDGQLFLLPGHTLALSLLAANALFYVLVVQTKLSDPAKDVGGTAVPTLTAILLLVMLIGWALGALAFLLDRYRVPLVAGLLVLAVATGSCARTDHVFTVRPPGPAYVESTPGAVLGQFPSNPILIAAAGGGIQAGAWATQVMQGLDGGELLNGDLRKRVALVSGVSGGAMGALYFGAYHDDGSLAEIRALAAKSSLDEVATTLVGRDVWRVFGLRRSMDDRGTALERTWHDRATERGADLTLRAWAKKAGELAPSGRRFPAFLFNATVVETGQPVAFATTQLPSARFRDIFTELPHRRPVVQSFNWRYELYDDRSGLPRDVGLSMATAARMSAAFPYVSPAAAPDWDADETGRRNGSQQTRKRYHLVDGGYYDNYGLVGLTQWLDDALTELEEKGKLPSRVTIVVIRDQERSEPEELEGWGWLKQVSGPPSTFLATRGYGHWAGGRAALKLLREKWQRSVAIDEVAFVYPLDDLRAIAPQCSDPPLSWILTPTEDDCIGRAWNASRAPIARFKALAAAD